MQEHIVKSLEDVLGRIDRLNSLIRTHKNQVNPDTLAIEGYQKLKYQYSTQVKELLHEFEIEVEIHDKIT
jgi:hypothetical protein